MISIQKNRKELNSDITDNLLGCILASCSGYMDEALFEICKLGEEITPKLIELFENKNATQQIKETIIQILQIQVYLHTKLTKEVPTTWTNLSYFLLEKILDELNGLSYQRIFSK